MATSQKLTLTIIGLSMVVVAPMAWSQPKPLPRVPPPKNRLARRPVAKPQRVKVRSVSIVKLRLLRDKMVVVTLFDGRELRGRLAQVGALAVVLDRRGHRPLALTISYIHRIRRFSQAETDAWLLRATDKSSRAVIAQPPKKRGLSATTKTLIVLGVVAGVAAIAVVFVLFGRGFEKWDSGESAPLSHVQKRSRVGFSF